MSIPNECIWIPHKKISVFRGWGQGQSLCRLREWFGDGYPTNFGFFGEKSLKISEFWGGGKNLWYFPHTTPNQFTGKSQVCQCTYLTAWGGDETLKYGFEIKYLLDLMVANMHAGAWWARPVCICLPKYL